MPDHDYSHPRSVWGVIALCATVGVTAAGAGWVVGRAYVHDELEQIRRSKEWRLPENLAALGELSKSLKLQVNEQRELLQLRKRLPQLEAQMTHRQQQLEQELGSANQQLEEAERRTQELAAELAKLRTDTFDVKEGEAYFVIPRLLAVGVNSASDILNTAEVVFGDSTAELKPGQSIRAAAGGKTHRVILVRIKDRTASFALAEN